MQGDVFQPDQMLRMTISNSYINTKAGKLPYQTIKGKWQYSGTEETHVSTVQLKLFNMLRQSVGEDSGEYSCFWAPIGSAQHC